MALYAPLEFFNSDVMKEAGFETGNVYKQYCPIIFENLFEMKESEYLSEEEFVKYILHRDFMRKDTTNPLYAHLNNQVIKHADMILDTLGYTEKDIRKAMGNAQTGIYIQSDFRDALVMAVLLDRWAKSKQVLKPDATFAKYLISTDKLTITKDTFAHLPFTNFYIDLEACNKDNFYGNVCGAYVDITQTDTNIMAVSLSVLSRDMMIFSQYISMDLKNPIHVDTNRFSNNTSAIKTPALKGDERYADKTDLNIQALITITMQLINYMNVKEPDITPAPEMAYTYKPSTHKIKNKYSEVYKQEVGIKIGKKISQNIADMKAAETKEIKKITMRNDSNRTHKPPIPHFRAAHWHHYWTGKGRTNYEIRWIEPVFVCGSYDSSVAGNVTVHNVEE